MAWRVLITITKPYEDREEALERMDAIIDKVPDGWEIREQDIRFER